MKTIPQLFATVVLATVVTSPIFVSGCAHHYRAYDPYYNGYRDWNHGEDVYYTRWETETHRNHVDYRNRKADEQKEYWDWRHNHANDYDHDHH